MWQGCAMLFWMAPVWLRQSAVLFLSVPKCEECPEAYAVSLGFLPTGFGVSMQLSIKGLEIV